MTDIRDIRPDVGSKPPSWAGEVVAVTVSKDTVFIACQRGVFRLCSHGLRPIAFLDAAVRSNPMRATDNGDSIGIDTSGLEKIDA